MIPLQITGIAVGIVVLYLLSCIRILKEYQRGVVFRLGRVLAKAQRAWLDPHLLADRPDGASESANVCSRRSFARRHHT